MASRVDPIEQDISLLISQDLSPEAQSQVLAEFALQTRGEAEAVNEAALGHPVTYETFVDGVSGASEASVRPSGTIAYEFELVEEMFAWIADQLERNSPVGSGSDPHPGLYEKSHIFYADDVEADPLKPPPDIKVGTFVNALPYARKIEAGESPQFPDGVYEAVTHLAAQRFGNIARITNGFRAIESARGSRTVRVNTGGKERLSRGAATARNPAIIVTVK